MTSGDQSMDQPGQIQFGFRFAKVVSVQVERRYAAFMYEINQPGAGPISTANEIADVGFIDVDPEHCILVD
jgi:hypothetical protein